MKKTICDCGCGQELTGEDAGQVPVMLAHNGFTVRVQITGTKGEHPNIRPSCVRGLIERADMVYPALPRAVDAGVRETAAPRLIDADDEPEEAAG